MPFFPNPEYDEVIACGFLQHSLNRLGGLHDHNPRAPAGRFGEFLGEYTLCVLFHAWLRTSRADNVQERHVCTTAAT